MADKFYAAGKIKFGRRTEDGSQDGKYESIVFEPNQEVKGLSTEDMKSLWDAGALTRKAPEADEVKAEDDKSSAPPAKATPAKAATTGSRGASQS